MAPERDPGSEPDVTPDAGAVANGRCRAILQTTHTEPETVAAAITPDNTPEMRTRVEGGRVVTTIARDSPGGLHSTVDDYVVNLQVADSIADEHRSDTP